MNEWKCTVKTPSNFLQDVYVEAYTRADAVAAAEHSTGGKCINAFPIYDTSSSVNSDYGDNESGSSIDGGFILAVALIVFLVYAWKWVLLIGGIAALIWFAIQFSKD